MLLKLTLSQMPFISYLKVPKKELNLYDKSWMDPVAEGQVFWFQLSAEFKLFLSISLLIVLQMQQPCTLEQKGNLSFFCQIATFLKPSPLSKRQLIVKLV